MRFTLLAAFALAAVPVASFAAGAPPALTVTFTGIAAPTGKIMIGLYDSEAAYAGGKPVRGAMVAIAGTADVSTVFAGLAPGSYAIKAFHDVDGDGKMGTNPFGLPTEPFAFSNDAHGEMGPAKWAQASFTVTADGASQRITIK